MKLVDPDVLNDAAHLYDWDSHAAKAKKARKQPVTFWTDEKVARLRRLWRLDAKAATIGAELGCTKNAVIGKAYRLGLNRRAHNMHRRPSQKVVRGAPFVLRDRKRA